MKTSFFAVTILLLTAHLIINIDSLKAQEPKVWECYTNSCQVPNQYQTKSKDPEVEEDRKFHLKIDKIQAKEPKKFPQYGKQNTSTLGLDKRKPGNFSAFSFPNTGN